MSLPSAATPLELRVGPYRLGLRAAQVRRVTDASASVTPCIDLAPLFGLPLRPQSPFALLLQSSSGEVWLGVDAIRHIPRATWQVSQLPTFGVLHAHLFEGVMRLPDGLLLVLDAEQLAMFVAARFDAVFA